MHSLFLKLCGTDLGLTDKSGCTGSVTRVKMLLGLFMGLSDLV